MTFDLATHQRERIRALERDNTHLEAVRKRLERLIALLLQVAAGDACNPIALLHVLELLDQQPAVHPAIAEAREVIRLEQELRDAQARTAA